MAMNAVKEGTSLERYAGEVHAIWGDGKDPQLPYKVKGLLEKLLARTAPDEPWMARLIEEAKEGEELYRDPDRGFIQMGHIHPKGHKNQPHDHGPCWVLYGVYRGEIAITTYKRTDDGSRPGKATLETKEMHRLTPGVVYAYLAGEIHSTRAVEAPAVVLRFLSADLTRIKRSRFNLEKGTVALT